MTIEALPQVKLRRRFVVQFRLAESLELALQEGQVLAD